MNRLMSKAEMLKVVEDCLAVNYETRVRKVEDSYTVDIRVGKSWAPIIPTVTIPSKRDVNPHCAWLQLALKIDLHALKKQKRWLLKQNSVEGDGIVGILDSIQDVAVDEYGVDESIVFDLEPDEPPTPISVPPIPRTCPMGCGHVLAPTERFCPHCILDGATLYSKPQTITEKRDNRRWLKR